MSSDIFNSLQIAKSSHTSLITFILEAGADISKKRHKIIKELSSCVNIKDKQNRKNVQTGLKSIQEKLLLHSRINPKLDTGLALFSGCYI
jgi:peptide subunit release factor 1 (eRF1)